MLALRGAAAEQKLSGLHAVRGRLGPDWGEQSEGDRSAARSDSGAGQCGVQGSVQQGQAIGGRRPVRRGGVVRRRVEWRHGFVRRRLGRSADVAAADGRRYPLVSDRGCVVRDWMCSK